VKKLGGDVDIQSKLGEGTTFVVFLPRKRTEGGEGQHEGL
jgi:signal transduction histidine kinase